MIIINSITEFYKARKNLNGVKYVNMFSIFVLMLVGDTIWVLQSSNGMVTYSKVLCETFIDWFYSDDLFLSCEVELS